jgi:hypothetical protein
MPTKWILAGITVLLGCQVQTGKVQSISQPVSIDSIDGMLNGPPDRHWTPADDAVLAPVWRGDDDHGILYFPLWRGVASALEDYVPAPDSGDCSNMKGTARIDWDRGSNQVHYLLKYRGLIPHPVVHRTEGVNWFPNPFHRPPKDLESAGYRFWTLFGRINSGLVDFYYDPVTLLLLGSQYDFPSGPPANVIVLKFPIFPIICSLIFQPDETGFAVHEFTVPYDHVAAEGGAVSFSANSFIPIDLCEAAPLQPTISQLRPYVSPWQPPQDGPSWAEILHAGAIFDTTIDDTSQTYPGGVFPYIYSDVSLLSNAPSIQGGVPNGSFLHIPSAIQNVVPAIRPLDFGNGAGCQPLFHDPHVTAPRYCELAH